MTKLINTAIIALAASATAAAAVTTPSKSWTEDQSVFGVNKEKAHATYTPYATSAELKADGEFLATPWIASKSTLRKSLNGNWKFHYAPTVDQAPADFYESGYDSSDWDRIPVPSCWQMLGYDTPMYINVDYPFDKTYCPRIVPRTDNDGYDTNPVGSYLTEFSVPSAWSGRQLFINFEGIYSGAYIWVNGQFVGYTQGANTDHEFDITPYARQGNNSLAVKVIKWTDGSYLEDQDMFRYGGIFRDVTLTALPRTFIRDHYITAELGKDYAAGDMTVSLEFDNRSTATFTGTATVSLLGTDGKSVVTTLPDIAVSLEAGTTRTLSTTATLSGLKGWTAETPNLYTVLVTLKDASGKETEAFATKYGFRKIEQVGTFVYINGKKVFFKGVNRQDTHPVTGRMQTTETLLQDVKLYKQFNINTVRTSHCPHQPKMMAMYDHFGIYVMDEADLEAHAMDGRLTNDASWSPAFVDREVRMVLRDRNHPSVIFWSLGNETKNGSNFTDCYDAVRALDPRMIHYEGQEDYSTTDITSKMYPYEKDVINADYRNDSRPHFYCEYAHAMGQSLGNFVDYWNYIENSRRTIGGCIWDWADQAIYDPKEIVAGTYKHGDYRTGYDYPGPHQDNFVSNGIVGPEREISQKLVEVKKVHQWIKMKDFSPEAKSLTVNNTYDFIDLSDFTIEWSVSKNGRTVESGTVSDFNVASEKFKSLTIPYNTTVTDDAEYLLTVRFVTRNATDWADAGHTVAEEQFAINGRPALPEIDLTGMTATLETRGNGPVVISGEGFSYGFDATGNLVSMNFGGHDYIYNDQGLKFDSYRWIENDAPYSGLPPAGGMNGYQVNGTGMYCNFMDGDATGAKAVQLIACFENPGAVSYRNYYTVYADGTLDLKTVYINKTSDTDDQRAIERIGQSMSLNPALENLEYFARGPWSNYSDRKTASFAAVYNSTVTDEHEHFVRPQSMGNHEELRYLKLTSKDDPDFGLLIEAEGQVSFSALHHTEADYGTASHDLELQPRKEVILHLDYQQKGLGNGSCGSRVWTRYLIPANKELTNKLRFTPLTSKSGGYSTPAGTKGAYLTSLSADGTSLDYTAAAAPEELYNIIATPVSVETGKSITLSATTSKAAVIGAWIDWNQDLEFSADEKLSELTITTGAGIKTGDYRMRLVIEESATPKANGTVAAGSVYDLTVRVTPAGIGEVKYSTPDGELHEDRLAFVKEIFSTGADKDIKYEATECPATVYTILPERIKATAGRTFTITFNANEAGPRSTTEVAQDLRYNYAGVFADFTGSSYLEQVGFFGRKITYDDNDKITPILGNYDEIMTFTQTFYIPADTKAHQGRIRVIYNNAWDPLAFFGPDMQTIKEGIAYDIVVDIQGLEEGELDFTTLPEMSYGIPEGTTHSDGKAWVKQISTTGAKTDINVTFNAQPEFYTALTDVITADAGSTFTLNMIANEAGPKSETVNYQDLRFNTATFYLSLAGSFEMKPLGSVGDIISGPSSVANYDLMMKIAKPIEIPATATPGEAVIRVIYQNAWKPYPAFDAKNIIEGVAYDIPLYIEGKQDAIEEIPAYDDATTRVTYDLLGRRVGDKVLRPGIYIVNGVKTIIR